MLTSTHDARQKALAAVPADGEFHALGAPFAKGARAKRRAQGGIEIDLSGAALVDKRDRGPAARARAMAAPPFEMHAEGVNVRRGGVQSVQRFRGMTPRVVT